MRRRGRRRRGLRAGGASAECLRLLDSECGAEQVAAWDGSGILQNILSEQTECAPTCAFRLQRGGAVPPVLPAARALVEVLDGARNGVGPQPPSEGGQQANPHAVSPQAGRAASEALRGGAAGSRGQALIASVRQRLYGWAVGGGHWDVAAWALQLPQPPCGALPTAALPGERSPAAGSSQDPAVPSTDAPAPAPPPTPACAAASTPVPTPRDADSSFGPLLRAVASGDTPLVQRLLRQPGAQGQQLYRPTLALAAYAYQGHAEVLRMLLARLEPSARLGWSDVWAGLQAAAIGGGVEAVEVLLGVLRARAGRGHRMSIRGWEFADVRDRALRAGHGEVADALLATEALIVIVDACK